MKERRSRRSAREPPHPHPHPNGRRRARRATSARRLPNPRRLERVAVSTACACRVQRPRGAGASRGRRPGPAAISGPGVPAQPSGQLFPPALSATRPGVFPRLVTGLRLGGDQEGFYLRMGTTLKRGNSLGLQSRSAAPRLYRSRQ